jgi:anti-sigma regulatory factor (Ser/Thr protein kinase)
MCEAAVAESVTIAAVPERVGRARAFVAAVLGESRPCSDLAVLLASELVTNSVRHSGSAVPGGLVTLAVAVCAGGVRVEVTDRSGDGAPVLPPAAFADAPPLREPGQTVDFNARPWPIPARLTAAAR